MRPRRRPAIDDQRAPGLDGRIAEALVRAGRHFRTGEVSADQRTLHQIGGREADSFYRDRWSQDRSCAPPTG